MKITKSQLQQVIREAIQEEMESDDPLALLAQADMLAQELADAGEDRGAQISAILNRLHSAMTYSAYQDMDKEL